MGEVQTCALKNINLDISPNEFTAIIGPSGSGKSTMMNLLGCLDKPSRGNILLNSKNIAEMNESDLSVLRGKTIGFVFQQYNLIPGMSALENVLLPLEIQEIDDDKALERANEVLGMVGLSDKVNNMPYQLSGGQQQRVSIARSLACDPDIILADEPTGALDSRTGRDVMDILYNLWKEEDKTVIIVTHDMNLAQYAKRHIVLKDGMIVRDVTNENPIEIGI
ncbi:ABC transporter ATP-binding protein [Methanolobus sp. ZRKC2]|uniref:ABC transporter ATP-binding protein n=1 Tax=Methanolobus sp. ZRKC2 TaxID=3125783 RepID=UPI003254EC23